MIPNNIVIKVPVISDTLNLNGKCYDVRIQFMILDSYHSRVVPFLFGQCYLFAVVVRFFLSWSRRFGTLPFGKLPLQSIWTKDLVCAANVEIHRSSEIFVEEMVSLKGLV